MSDPIRVLAHCRTAMLLTTAQPGAQASSIASRIRKDGRWERPAYGSPASSHCPDCGCEVNLLKLSWLGSRPWKRPDIVLP